MTLLRNILAAATAIAVILTGTWVFSGPSYAQSTCQFTLNDTAPQLAAKGIPFAVIIDPEKVAEFVATLDPVPEGVTAVLLAEIQGTLVYGLVIDGCLLPPVPLSEPERLGGTSGGKTGA